MKSPVQMIFVKVRDSLEGLEASMERPGCKQVSHGIAIARGVAEEHQGNRENGNKVSHTCMAPPFQEGYRRGRESVAHISTAHERHTVRQKRNFRMSVNRVPAILWHCKAGNPHSSSWLLG